MTTGHFKRAMGLLDATAVVVGSMIGSGIFIVSAETSRLLGSPGWLLMGWVAASLLTFSAAVCYGELAAMYPQAGGQYIFLRQAYGPLYGFLYGWTLFAVIQCGTIAAVAVAFAKFLGVFLPFVSAKMVFVEIGSWHFTSLQLVALLVISLLTYINCQGISTAKMIQTVFTVSKVSAVLLLIALGLILTSNWHGLPVNFGADMWKAQDLKGNVLTGFPLIAIFSLAMVGPLFSSDAWNNVTFAGEEVKDAEKTLPRSLMNGTLLVGLLYFVSNIVYLLILPMHGDPNAADVVGKGIQYAAEDRVGTAVAQILFGQYGAQIMAAAIMVSTFGALNGCILSGPRAYYAMAKDGLFFKAAAVLHPEKGVPTFGLIIQGVWAAILTTTGTYSNLLEYVVFAAMLFYILTVAALILLRKKEPTRERPFKVPAYPFLPLFYVVFAIVIMIGQIYASPQYSGFGLLIILSGLPAYLLWRRKIIPGNKEAQ
jgi:basic amino acid/polyamine antiporter, APA family